MSIKGTGIELTEAIKQYVEEKFGDLDKFFDNIQKIEVDVGLRSQHHNKGNIFYAEVNVHVPGRSIRVVKETEDLYKAIDKVRDHLKSELKEFKDKLNRVDKQELRDTKEYDIEN
ncbi:MAG: ribosomal subunit interface protein [Candidatus Magasanikbacteria bacterium RIFCSPHIGHO2_01_FULL_33_34]|uniref:Ribosomal subunit interface protein n=1 Tax=Candidatus Magasanikbacteria bacterium RIFCSPHIGHO2_01_FULL_33_34 TaxID=1798671 RepID=A0A1F6LHD7_9BACT|nr:MAG: ribosomal subunit interface protein [Candidatus Magasanikbacteria bacterium RIFCSPHIGHO2_01_FULL_33_34]OGH65075.1 MAG: ribosomal subunit interface protein [Candidatus Magasanikbacteria bacterium RIFCSPHIGHO2_02_FULL_33_17]OGH75381.1 MAG: ribosomal subunit interface protein [Candidatus Magasanikbacteria bacterium RIFCSPLOWO2_01_FULL_33_34]